MSRPSWMALCAAVLLVRSAPGAEVVPLTKAEMAGAAKVDTLSVPTAGELFAAINKHGKPNWQAQYRAPIPMTYTSRPQIALNLGGLIADGYVAVEAEDSQQVKNVGKDVVTLAKALGVSQNVLGRGSSISQFAENNEWTALKEELDATQNEVKLAMEEQHDDQLVILVSLGGWIRGTEVVSSWIADNYSPGSAALVRQPALVAYLRDKINVLPDKIQHDDLVRTIRGKLVEIEHLLAIPATRTPTVEEIKQLKVQAAELVAVIAKKEGK